MEKRMKPLKVKVTAKNIQDAKRGDSHRCMIADAIQHSIKDAGYVSVDAQSIRLTDDKNSKRLIYLTPKRAQRALIAFDEGKDVKPFTFTASVGIERTMRVRQGNGIKRKLRKAQKKKSDKPKRYMPIRFRKLGLRTGK